MRYLLLLLVTSFCSKAQDVSSCQYCSDTILKNIENIEEVSKISKWNSNSIFRIDTVITLGGSDCLLIKQRIRFTDYRVNYIVKDYEKNKCNGFYMMSYGSEAYEHISVTNVLNFMNTEKEYFASLDDEKFFRTFFSLILSSNVSVYKCYGMKCDTVIPPVDLNDSLTAEKMYLPDYADSFFVLSNSINNNILYLKLKRDKDRVTISLRGKAIDANWGINRLIGIAHATFGKYPIWKKEWW